jgi:hypothetical protein
MRSTVPASAVKIGSVRLLRQNCHPKPGKPRCPLGGVVPAWMRRISSQSWNASSWRAARTSTGPTRAPSVRHDAVALALRAGGARGQAASSPIATRPPEYPVMPSSTSQARRTRLPARHLSVSLERLLRTEACAGPPAQKECGAVAFAHAPTRTDGAEAPTPAKSCAGPPAATADRCQHSQKITRGSDAGRSSARRSSSEASLSSGPR